LNFNMRRIHYLLINRIIKKSLELFNIRYKYILSIFLGIFYFLELIFDVRLRSFLHNMRRM